MIVWLGGDRMIGLVLQGGGAKGAYHIGVWKALRELNIEIGAVTGTSVGALNGAFIVQDKYDEAYNLWYNMDPRLVTSQNPDIYHELVTGKVTIKKSQEYLGYLALLIKQKGLDIEPLKELIKQEVDEKRVRKSNIDFGLVTVSLTELKPIELFVEDIEEGALDDYLLASAFLPGFKPQMINGKRFIDGAFYDNLPINLMATKGYKEIVTVELDSVGRIQSVKDKSLNIRRIVASGDTGSMLEFDKNRCRKNILMGYYDTMKSYGYYEGEAYYLTKLPDEAYFYKRLCRMNDDYVKGIANSMGYTKGYPKRLISEAIIPEVSRLLGFGIDKTYQEIMVGILEYVGAAIEIDRLRPYTYEAFISAIRTKFKTLPQKIIEWEDVPKILKRSSILQTTFKKERLTKWLKLLLEEYYE